MLIYLGLTVLVTGYIAYVVRKDSHGWFPWLAALSLVAIGWPVFIGFCLVDIVKGREPDADD